MFSLAGKKAVITGGGSGIGKAISLLFARQGADVHIIEISEERSELVAEEIRTNGGNASSYTCNVANQQEVLDTFYKIGSTNIIINNAGIANVGKADNTLEEDFDRIVNVNIKGVYNCLYAGIPHVRNSKGGVIINVASVAALVGISERFAYSAAKGAVIAMTLSVAKDYLNEGIRCNSVSPARVHSPFVDGFISKNYPGRKRKFLKNYQNHNP